MAGTSAYPWSARATPSPHDLPLRLDKFLWYARLLKSRSESAKLCESRHLRLDGRVIDKAHAGVRVGSVISFPCHGEVVIVRVLVLPVRRISPADKKSVYQDLSPREKAAIIITNKYQEPHSSNV
jgi:ribosome-associated heat shock protein Hsp15